MAITTVLNPPLATDDDPTFDGKAFPFAEDLNPWAEQANALAVEINGYAAAAETAKDDAESAAAAAAASEAAAASDAGAASISAGEAELSAQSAGQIAADIAQDVVNRLQLLTNWKGAWIAGSYSQGESVSYADEFYISNINNNTSTPGVNSDWDLIDFGNLIAKPVIVTPPDGQTDFYSTIVSSAFATYDNYVGVQDFVHWQLSQLPDFSVLDDEYQGASNLTTWTPAFVDQQTTLYVRVKHGSDGHLSSWSDAISYTTPQVVVAKPSITAPADGATDVPLNPVLVGSPYQIFGFSDPHASSDYRLATDVGMTNIVYQLLGSNDLTSHFVADSQDLSTTLYAQIRYNSTNYGASEWSDPVGFTTTDTVEIIKLIDDTAGGQPEYRDCFFDGSDYVSFGQYNNDDTAFFCKSDTTYNITSSLKSFGTGSTSIGSGFKADNNDYIFSSQPTSSSKRLIRTDSNFNVLRVVSDDSSDIITYYGVDQLQNGYAVAARNNSNTTALAALLDVNLNVVSASEMQVNSAFFSSAYDSMGNIYFAGANFATDKSLIVKFDQSLNVVSVVELNITASSAPEGVTNIIVDELDNVFVVCSIDGPTGSSNSVVCKMNTSLSVLSSVQITSYGVENSPDNRINDIKARGNGKVVICGEGDEGAQKWAFVANLDANLSVESIIDIRRNTNDYFNTISIDSQGNYAASGRSGTAALFMSLPEDLSIVPGFTPSLGFEVRIPTYSVTNNIAASVASLVTSSVSGFGTETSGTLSLNNADISVSQTNY